MPSAASVKVEKVPANNLANNVAATSAVTLVDGVDNNSPIRQALVIIEHKIRNLEKRKSKLESYRDNEKSGKDLSADQKVAVSKYNEVAMTLEFAREFSKQIVQIVSASEKDLKKKQKKEETSRKQGEIFKIREVLMIQDVLKLLSDETVRKDFVEGTNGACKLEEADFEVLDIFYEKIVPQRPQEYGGVPFKTAVQKAAEFLSLTIEGKQKDFETSSFAHIKTLFKNIHKCAYFDKSSMPPTDIVVDVVESTGAEPIAEEKFDNNVETFVEISTGATTTIGESQAIDRVVDASAETYSDSKNAPETFNSTSGSRHNIVGNVQFHEAPCAAAVPVPTFAATPLNAQNGSQAHQSLPQIVQAQQQQTNILASPGQQQIGGHVNANIQLQTQVPPGGHQLHSGHVQPTTVRAVEQAYFKQHATHMQQIRPLFEVLGGGNFFFLQESELDSPDVNSVSNNSPATLHTNQSFPNVVYANIKPPVDIAQQAVNQIPGFATQNAPIPIPIVQPKPLAMASALQSHQQPPPQQQPQQPQHTNSSTNPAQIMVQQQFSDPNKFITASAIPISKMGPTAENAGIASDLLSKSTDIGNEQRVPEISEWKPEEVVAQAKPTKHHSSSKEIADCTNGNSTWRDPYASNKNSQETNEWNGGSGGGVGGGGGGGGGGNGAGGVGNDANEAVQDESNNWSSCTESGPRYQFRPAMGVYGRNNRASGNAGRKNNGTGNNANNLSGNNSNNNTNGYRSRPNSNNGSNTFYRNNDPYYQNGGNRGGEKSENYGNRPYRGRDSRGENNPNGAASSYKPMPQRNSNQNQNNNSNRLNSNGTGNGPNKGNHGNGGGGGGGGGAAAGGAGGGGGTYGDGNHRSTGGGSSNTGRNPLSPQQSAGINA